MPALRLAGGAFAALLVALAPGTTAALAAPGEQGLAGGMEIAQQVGSNALDFCTIGYLATDSARGALYALTAGHCLVGQGPMLQYQSQGEPSSLGNPVVLGDPVAETDVSSAGMPTPADAGLVLLNGQSGASADVVGAGERLPVKGAADPLQGETVCKSGTLTGFTCGQVTATNQTYSASDASGGPAVSVTGAAVFQAATGVTLCRPGDSGAPVFRTAPDGSVTAEGIVVAGPAQDPSVCFFSPLSAAFAALGARGFNLSLLVDSQPAGSAPVTPAPAAPPATAPAPTGPTAATPAPASAAPPAAAPAPTGTTGAAPAAIPGAGQPAPDTSGIPPVPGLFPATGSPAPSPQPSTGPGSTPGTPPTIAAPGMAPITAGGLG